MIFSKKIMFYLTIFCHLLLFLNSTTIKANNTKEERERLVPYSYYYIPTIENNFSSYPHSTKNEKLSFNTTLFPYHYDNDINDIFPLHLFEEDENSLTRYINEINDVISNTWTFKSEKTEKFKNSYFSVMHEFDIFITECLQNINPLKCLNEKNYFKYKYTSEIIKNLIKDLKYTPEIAQGLTSDLSRSVPHWFITKILPLKVFPLELLSIDYNKLKERLEKLEANDLRNFPKIGPMSTKYCMTECHEMKNPASEYLYSAHYTNYKNKYGASCTNCHLYPETKELIYSYKKQFAIGGIFDKQRAGAKEVLAHLINEFPNAKTFDKHRVEMALSVKYKIKMEEAFSCRQCHYIPSLEEKSKKNITKKDHHDETHETLTKHQKSQLINSQKDQLSISNKLSSDFSQKIEEIEKVSREHYLEIEQKIKEKNPGAEMSLHKQSLFAMKMHDFSRHNNIHSCTDCHLGVAHQVKSKYFDKIANHTGPVTVVSQLNYPENEHEIIRDPQNSPQLRFTKVRIENHDHNDEENHDENNYHSESYTKDDIVADENINYNRINP